MVLRGCNRQLAPTQSTRNLSRVWNWEFEKRVSRKQTLDFQMLFMSEFESAVVKAGLKNAAEITLIRFSIILNYVATWPFITKQLALIYIV